MLIRLCDTFYGKLIKEKSGIEMEMIQVFRRDINKHLGIHVIDIIFKVMIDGFKEHYRDKICRMDMVKIVNNAVAGGDYKTGEGIKCKHIGCKKLIVVDGAKFSTVPVRVIKRSRTVNNLGVKPAMNVMEFEPSNRGQIQVNMNECRIAAGKNICTMIIGAPFKIILDKAQAS
jgi:hypothetical protein